MVLKRIEITSQSQGDLPFLNKMGDDFDELVDTNWFVREVILCDSGYLVLTSKFKGFLFRESEIYKFLTEALNVWITHNEPSYPLFAVVLPTKKISLAVDDEAFSSRWSKSGLKYLQSQDPLEQSSLTIVPSNPLLPPTSVVPTSKRQPRKSSTPPPDHIGH